MIIALVLDSVCWGLFDEPDDSTPDYLNDPRYQVVDSQYADDIRIGWVLSDGVWAAPPPPAQQYKREGLTQGEWYRLFTGPELTMHNRLKAYINDMSYDFSSFLPGHAILDTPATALGRPDASYRDLMRDVFEIFDKATYPPGISCSSPRVAFAMKVQIALGLISSQERSDEILLGLPL